jgi:hypothetical protein
MSKIGSYKNTAFSESQKFLVLDPSTSSASLVLASELVAYITPQIGSVKAESTRLSAENTDYKVGEIIQTSGATVVGSLASIYLVVAGGSGDFPMLNGNDLLVIAGDDTLREQLISEALGQGASLVSMEGGPTVEVAVNNRVIQVSSRTEMKAYDVPANYQFNLSEGGRSGLFVVKTGAPPTDPEEGVYVVLTNGNYAERLGLAGYVFAPWFGAIAGTNANTATQAAANLAEILGIKEIRFPQGAFTITTKIYFACDDATIRQDLFLISGAGQNVTVLECRATSDWALFGSRLQLKDIKLNGPGKNNGDACSGLRHHPNATSTKGKFENVEFTNLSGEACRIASVYGWEFDQCRVEVNNDGVVVANDGPFGTVNATGLAINDSYLASNNGAGLRFLNGGVFNSLISATYFEFNGIGIVANNGSSITLENCWFEGNATAGLQGVDVNVKVLGTLVRQGAGDVFDIDYSGGGTVQPAIESLQEALKQDIVWRDRRLGHRSTRSILTNFHVFNAVGTETGLRDKNPVASMDPVINLQLFVQSDGSVDTLDQYGLTIAKSATGVYDISWPDTTFTLGTGGSAKIPHVSVTPVAGLEIGTASPRFAAYQYIGANWAAFRVATGIKVRTFDVSGTAQDTGFSVTISLRLGNGTGLAADFNLFGRNTV